MEKVEDIRIEGEGMQILKLLMKTLRLSKRGVLQRYSDKIGIYDTTINQYLKNKAINNEKFKSIIEEDFGKSYEVIVRTAKNQIIHYIESMRNEIYLYKEEKDLINTNELIQLCQQHNLPYHKLIAKGNRARIMGNMRLNREAKSLLEEVILESKGMNYLDLYIYYVTNLAYIHNNDEEYSIARKKLRELENFVKEEIIENKWVLHKYWYVYGITMQSMEMYPTSAEKFKLAYEFADNLDDEIKSLINVALSYKLDRRYDLANEWNEIALKGCQRNKIMKATVLNNIALFYYEKGEIEKAKWYINEAKDHMPENMDISRKVNVLDSYLIIEEDCEEILEEIINILLDSSRASENRKYLYRCIDNLIDKLINYNHLNLLIRLRDQLKLLIKAEVNTEDVLQLKARFSDIMIYLMEKGGVTTC